MNSGSKSRKVRAPRNRSIDIEESEVGDLRAKLVFELASPGAQAIDVVVCGDAFEVLRSTRSRFDLLFADPPYNLNKSFGDKAFKERSSDEYEEWLDSWLSLCVPLLKPTASVYICGDWRSGSAIQRVGSKYFHLRNRITWEREKGRGAKANWKNAAEDIWFFTVSDEYTFNLDAVKQRRRVLAPYKEDGIPKDWNETEGRKFSRHASVKPVDRHQRSILVNAGEHRPSDTKTGKTARQDHPRQYQRRRPDPRPVRRQRNDRRHCQKARAPFCRDRIR